MSCIQCEEFRIEQSGINFASISSEDEKINQGLLPKVVLFIYLFQIDPCINTLTKL